MFLLPCIDVLFFSVISLVFLALVSCMVKASWIRQRLLVIFHIVSTYTDSPTKFLFIDFDR